MKSLQNLPQSYFEHKISTIPPVKKNNLWNTFFLFIVLYLFLPTNYIVGKLPLPVILNNMIWIVPCFLYLILCIIFFFTKDNVPFFIFLLSYSLGLLLLEIWLFISQLAMVMYATKGGNTINTNLSYTIFLVSLFTLFGIIIIYIYVYRHMKKRVVQGHYRKNGKGFLDNHQLQNRFFHILIRISPLAISLPIMGRIISSFWKITWNSPFIPIITILLALFLFTLAYIIAYGNAMYRMKIYYYQRFEK